MNKTNKKWEFCKATVSNRHFSFLVLGLLLHSQIGHTSAAHFSLSAKPYNIFTSDDFQHNKFRFFNLKSPSPKTKTNSSFYFLFQPETAKNVETFSIFRLKFTKRIRIRQSRNETNLFGVRIRDPFNINFFTKETINYFRVPSSEFRVVLVMT